MRATAGGFQIVRADRALRYSGAELRPHFLLETFGVRGSGAVAFRGPCEVKLEKLVDWEDRLSPDTRDRSIRAHEMLHLILELFHTPLPEAVALQRLCMAGILETLIDTVQVARPQLAARLARTGDDLWLSSADRTSRRKLSVSIATASAVSSLIHIGLNINPEDAPVPAVGLEEILPQGSAQVDAFSERILQRISDEIAGISWACVKVRPVV